MRPRIIKSPEQFDQAVEEYLAQVAQEKTQITLTGLILALGLSSRQSLAHYEGRSEFCDSVRRAKLLVEHEYEKRLFGAACTGAVFALKNFGWKETSSRGSEKKEDISFSLRFVGTE